MNLNEPTEVTEREEAAARALWERQSPRASPWRELGPATREDFLTYAREALAAADAVAAPPVPADDGDPSALRVGDIIPYWDQRFGIHRFYRVEACLYGATGHQSLIELVSLTEKAGSVGGVAVETTMVPEPLLRDREVLRPVSGSS